MIFVCDTEGYFIDVMTSHEEMLFVPKKDLIGSNIKDIFTQKEAELFIKHINDTVISGRMQTLEYYLNIPSGAWYEAHTVPLGVNKILSLIVDITDRKHKEERLYIEKEQFKTTLLSVGDGVISADSNGRVSIINKAA
jgi:PAS domain S-box-containing protein